jgi:hypothetical protein
MDSRTVRYGRMGEVVILIFPDEYGSKNFISQIETKNLLKKFDIEKTPTPIAINPLANAKKTNFKPRVVA